MTVRQLEKALANCNADMQVVVVNRATGVVQGVEEAYTCYVEIIEDGALAFELGPITKS